MAATDQRARAPSKLLIMMSPEAVQYAASGEIKPWDEIKP
jgi:hypothetical protein